MHQSTPSNISKDNSALLGVPRVVEMQVHPGTVIRAGNTLLSVYPAWYVREVPLSESQQFGRLYGKSPLMRGNRCADPIW